MAVAVHVGHAQLVGERAAAAEAIRLGEAPLAVAPPQGDLARAVHGYRQVGLPVAVEVRDLYVARAARRVERRRLAEIAVRHAGEQQQHVARPPRRDHVAVAVAVEIAHRHGGDARGREHGASVEIPLAHVRQLLRRHGERRLFEPEMALIREVQKQLELLAAGGVETADDQVRRFQRIHVRHDDAPRREVRQQRRLRRVAQVALRHEQRQLAVGRALLGGVGQLAAVGRDDLWQAVVVQVARRDRARVWADGELAGVPEERLPERRGRQRRQYGRRGRQADRKSPHAVRAPPVSCANAGDCANRAASRIAAHRLCSRARPCHAMS